MAIDYNLISSVSADALILDRRQGIDKHASSNHHPHPLFLHFKTLCLMEAFIKHLLKHTLFSCYQFICIISRVKCWMLLKDVIHK